MIMDKLLCDFVCIVGICLCMVVGGLGFDVMVVCMFEGDCVLMMDGDDVGKFIYIMFDVCVGWVVYVVVLLGGLFGFGDKLFVVLWNVFVFDVECECFVLLVNIECVCEVFGFDKSWWFVMVDLEWVEVLYVYYGCLLYWLIEEGEMVFDLLLYEVLLGGFEDGMWQY